MPFTAATTERLWKGVFLCCEGLVGAGFVYWLALRVASKWERLHGRNVLTAFLYKIMDPMIWLWLGAVMILLLVSPFLFRANQSRALRAWIIGAVGFAWFLGVWFGFL